MSDHVLADAGREHRAYSFDEEANPYSFGQPPDPPYVETLYDHLRCIIRSMSIMTVNYRYDAH